MAIESHIFVDPKTHQPLALDSIQKKNGRVISGFLSYKKRKFPIINSIPRFVHKKFYETDHQSSKEIQTSDSFGNKWNDKRHQVLGLSATDKVLLQEQFMAMLGCKKLAELKGVLKNAKRTLNAGCGVAWSEYLFNDNSETERHCVDISLSIETAYQRTKKLKNVIVSQASIFDLPYRNETFDIVYSLGVIHHTPDPRVAFMKLVEKLAPGGLIGFYIYNKKPSLREMADREIRKITTKLSYDECFRFSKKMALLGKAFSKIDQKLTIKEDISLLNIKKGTYNLHKFIYDHFLKCWYNPKQDIRFSSLVNQDWYHPGYASHHSKGEILGWFEEAKLNRVRCIQPKGWEFSGYFISGRR